MSNDQKPEVSRERKLEFALEQILGVLKSRSRNGLLSRQIRDIARSALNDK